MGRVLIAVGLVLLLASTFRGPIAAAFASLGGDLASIGMSWRWLWYFVRLAGFGCVAVGLLRIGRRAYSTAQMRAMHAKLAEAHQQLDSARGMLDGLLSSSMTTTGIASPVRSADGSARDFRVRLSNDDVRRWFPDARDLHQEHDLSRADASIPTKWLAEVLARVMEHGEPFCGCHRDESISQTRWYEVVAVKHREGACFTLADVTQRRYVEEQLRSAARTDALTRLPNRTHLKERISELLQISRHDPTRKFAVMFLDFDRFKVINDSLGHRFGDQLLISIGERLRASLRAIDTVCDPHHHMPARLGGDEFVVLIDGLARAQDALIVADRIQSDLNRPHRIDGQEIVCTASIGIAASDRKYAEADEILRDADLAMYSAKSSGRARHVMFDQHMRDDADHRLRIEEDLREAIECKRFVLEYQPIVDLETGHAIGFESLVRWAHPERGLIKPDEFLPIAEEVGLMTKIGPWVMSRACRTLAELGELRHGQDEPPIFVTINQSRREMLSAGLLAAVERVLKETEIEPSNLVVEITETVCVACLDDISVTLGKLKDMGVRVAIDDFGTGQSSYSTLHKLPVDMLKLDSSFLRATHGARRSAAILKSMIDLAHHVKLPVVAEGVETQEDLALLHSLECDYGQGWLFGEPTSAAAAKALLQEARARMAA